MIAAFNVNPPAAEQFSSAAAPETSIAPLCQCARAVFGWAVTDGVGAVGRLRGWFGGVGWSGESMVEGR